MGDALVPDARGATLPGSSHQRGGAGNPADAHSQQVCLPSASLTARRNYPNRCAGAVLSP